MSQFPGPPTLSSEPFGLQVARGTVNGFSVLNINGFQPAVPDDGGFYPLWENATSYTFPSTALTMTLASSVSGDTGIEILISGLDASYSPISETVTLNGTTGVVTVNKYLRINSLTTTLGNATGIVTAKNGSTVYAQINAGIGRSQMSIYTVPNGYTFYLQRINCWCGTILLGQQYAVYRLKNILNGISLTTAEISFFQEIDVHRYQPNKFVGGTDLVFEFATGAANGGSPATQEIAIYAEGLLIANSAS